MKDTNKLQDRDNWPGANNLGIILTDICEALIYVNNLKTYNNILKQSIRLSQKSYYEQIFNKVKNVIKGTWKTINGILNKTKRKKMFPKMFKDNGISYTHKKDIANIFNTFFT